MIEKIKRIVNFYRNGIGIENLKIVMTSETFHKIESEVKDLLKFSTEKTEGHLLFGCPVEIYDKIATDFYVCEIFDE